MPNNKKKKGGSKAKGGANRSNTANKDDLTGLDDILSNPEEMAAAAARLEAAENGMGYKPRTGRENAQIGLRGFTQATQNPAMFTDAMSMLRDPSAVKEAEAMMKDPEFTSEISQYMETLKNNSAFQAAMSEAQRKYQALLTDPIKMKEATGKYNAMMKSQQQQQQQAKAEAPTEAEAGGGSKSKAGIKEGDAVGEKINVAGNTSKKEQGIGVGDDGEPLGPEEDEGDEEDVGGESGVGKAVEAAAVPTDARPQVEEAKPAAGEGAPVV